MNGLGKLRKMRAVPANGNGPAATSGNGSLDSAPRFGTIESLAPIRPARGARQPFFDWEIDNASTVGTAQGIRTISKDRN